MTKSAVVCSSVHDDPRPFRHFRAEGASKASTKHGPYRFHEATLLGVYVVTARRNRGAFVYGPPTVVFGGDMMLVRADSISPASKFFARFRFQTSSSEDEEDPIEPEDINKPLRSEQF
uniref:Uncharacterized protein n=1 Tax=Romanomermis culicivorax TaxID=13658 RepID=A0A915I5N9_ROMCU